MPPRLRRIVHREPIALVRTRARRPDRRCARQTSRGAQHRHPSPRQTGVLAALRPEDGHADPGSTWITRALGTPSSRSPPAAARSGRSTQRPRPDWARRTSPGPSPGRTTSRAFRTPCGSPPPLHR